ncbi:hypothetical protein CP10139811_0379 [Chlamydia ibidis]|uniref:DUF378 domain-containing protein n=2 Tax=Chlamydia ibidis TaxID=1405396 RepID=S7J2E1_9CHLA|nr:DUF378 domain-containing protein [Chlamydia ibidis]EPP34398.1 hypothetical protein CP10139811_0379 [Chlamydia ibidis]EQM62959.1 hypothetical protein H359_0376 [Chlamydia ibidis 10-1398/6]
MLGKLVRGLSSLTLVLCALNVGILGLTNHKVNILAQLLGENGLIMRMGYIVTGIAGLISLLSYFSCCSKKTNSSCCSKNNHSSTDNQ